MTDFQKTAEAYQELKKKYQAGGLTEAEFKAQLEALMVQDQQGKWWMIGSETGLWYAHDGTNWVRADPPGMPEPVLPPKPAPEPEIKREAPAAVPNPPVPAAPRFVRNGWRSLGFIVLCAITVVLFAISVIEYSSLTSNSLWSVPALILGVALPLFGLLFGPWVAILGTGLPVAIALIASGGGSDSQALVTIFTLLFFSTFPCLVVKNPGNWIGVGLAGALAYFVFLWAMIANYAYSADYLFTRYLILLVLNTIILCWLSNRLIAPVRKRGWFWRDARAKAG